MQEIRFCKKDEYKELQYYIDNFWKKGHILATNKKLLDWQYLDDERYNFVVSVDHTKKINGILGFIPTYKFDKNLIKYNEIWLALWKAEKNGVGIKLLSFLINKLNPSVIGVLGVNNKVLPIYKMLGFEIAQMKHFFIKSNFYQPNISNIVSDCEKEYKNNIYKIKEISYEKINLLKNLDFEKVFHKSVDYIKNRYINHPFYKYKLFGVFDNEKLISLFITRKIIVNNYACLRIVDFIGEFIIENLKNEFQKILNNEKAEYIDFLCYMKDFDKVKKMGFCEKTEKDIIPEYFEPFEKKNVTINLAYKGSDDIYFFKADGDQDRPNVIKEV